MGGDADRYTRGKELSVLVGGGIGCSYICIGGLACVVDAGAEVLGCVV